MKKLWVVLLTLGLIAAFAMPAAAVDVKFSGEYYVQGQYANNPALKDKENAHVSGPTNPGVSPTANFTQRLRVSTEFKVVEGLKLVTRFDALETVWGSTDWTGTTQTSSRTATGANSAKVQENIEFERAYVDFNAAGGNFKIGYQQFMSFGTSFLNSPFTWPGVKYAANMGPATIIASYEKRSDYQGRTTQRTTGLDRDSEVYSLAGIYKFKQGDAGLQVQYYRDNANKSDTATSSYQGVFYTVNPYAKATFGKVFVEGELYWWTGTWKKYESTTQDVSLNALAAYLHAKVDFKPAYAGAKFIYISGNDPSNTDKQSGSVASTMKLGYGMNNTLILWNFFYNDSAYNSQGWAGTAAGSYMDNCVFYQVYGGFKPMAKLDIKAAVAYAQADQKLSTASVSKDYGTEIDLTASYKIYDNLEYMVGFGYLMTGDYFKGTSATNVVKDNYIVTNRLTLKF